MHLFSCLAHFCESLNRRIGDMMSWLTLAAIILMFANVVMRYFFDAGAPWQVELVLALHAATFLTVMGYTLQHGEQVRVDVLYSRWPARRKAWVDFFGSLFLLLPLTIGLMYFSWHFTLASWQLQEASSEYGGLQGIYLLKAFILIGPALLLLQGIAMAVRSLQLLSDKEA